MNDKKKKQISRMFVLSSNNVRIISSSAVQRNLAYCKQC